MLRIPNFGVIICSLSLKNKGGAIYNALKAAPKSVNTGTKIPSWSLPLSFGSVGAQGLNTQGYQESVHLMQICMTCFIASSTWVLKTFENSQGTESLFISKVYFPSRVVWYEWHLEDILPKATVIILRPSQVDILNMLVHLWLPGWGPVISSLAQLPSDSQIHPALSTVIHHNTLASQIKSVYDVNFGYSSL